jgi:hypothetical protein
MLEGAGDDAGNEAIVAGDLVALQNLMNIEDRPLHIRRPARQWSDANHGMNGKTDRSMVNFGSISGYRTAIFKLAESLCGTGRGQAGFRRQLLQCRAAVLGKHGQYALIY